MHAPRDGRDGAGSGCHDVACPWHDRAFTRTKASVFTAKGGVEFCHFRSGFLSESSKPGIALRTELPGFRAFGQRGSKPCLGCDLDQVLPSRQHGLRLLLAESQPVPHRVHARCVRRRPSTLPRALPTDC